MYYTNNLTELVSIFTLKFKLFNNVLLESHKVRIMFRRSGGYICLMTLLLHLENWLNPTTLCNQLTESRTTLQYLALIFQIFTVSMRFEPSNAKYFQSEVKGPISKNILSNIGIFTGPPLNCEFNSPQCWLLQSAKQSGCSSSNLGENYTGKLCLKTCRHSFMFFQRKFHF
jgi:hypothetical protein